MDERMHEFLSNNLFCKHDCGCLLDRRTRARIRREDRETWKALKYRGKIREKKALELQEKEGQKEEKEETKLDEEEDGEIKHYRFTKWSKLKIRRLKNEKEKWEAHLGQYRRQTFFTRLIELRATLVRQEWNRACHLKERTITRENIRLKNILRIRRKYNIDNTLPSDNIMFDKLLNHERGKKKQMKLRQERMVQIIEKVTREMTNGVRLLRNAPLKEMKLKEISDGSLAEISFEQILSVSEDSTLAKESLKEPSETEKTVPELTKTEHKIKKSKHKPVEDKIVKDEKDVEAEEEKVIPEDDFKKFLKLKESRTSTEQVFPKDKCFFATPNIVTFENFKVNNVYSRKITITNKTARWAYLRYHKVYTEVWEPGVVEIDIMDAARIKPGLHVTVNVKFSPVHEEEVGAEISFLTLNFDDTKTFHQFCVPVRCTPENALPVLDPKELQFPSAPIWKYASTKFNERTLSIANEGKVSFSIALEERNDHENYFLWYFDQEKLQSANSSILRLNESESKEINGELGSEDISDKQKSRKMYQIEVPPKIKCDLRITFKPRYVGVHHEVLEICFLNNNSIFDKQSVPIWADVTGYQIHLDPPCVDLGIVMIDSSICQQTFNIINPGRTTVKVLMKTPKCLGNQVSVQPKLVLVQPETFSKVTVKLMPESSITCTSKRFYDSLSNILDFPIQVQIVSQDEENPPPLMLKVLASLTTCHGLVLEPARVDLGCVYTHESVYAELNLTNESLLIQEYAFLNLPPSMEIQPNDGFGAVLPGETIKLHLIYSPYPKDIPGNELGANGISGERRFIIQVATLAELAGSKKRSIINNLKNRISMQSKISTSFGSPPQVPVEFKKSEWIAVPESGEVENDSDSVISHEHICDGEEIVTMPIEKSNDNDKREGKSSMKVYVYIVDTFCELSEQIIQFSATPCGSFNKASVQLRGFNLASYPHCTCGVLKNQKKEFTARYEFESSSDRVQIVPLSGTLNSNEFTEVSFIFKPRLPRSIIFEEGHRLKMNIVEQETKSEKSEKKGGTKRVAKKEPPDGKKNISEVDKFAGENSILETFEPCLSTIFITCKIEVEMKNGVKYNEVLYAKLICPIVKPEIIVLNENRVISFGPSAIGASTRRFLLVKNISNETVKVETSLLDPFGPFFVPPGKTIETGSILKLPVTYQPTQHREEDQECFEVFSSRTRTRWSVKLSGRGVVPSYVFKPRFRVVRLEIIGNNPAEVRMSMQNTGLCPLIFRLSIMDVLEGDIQRVYDESTQKSSRKKKMKSDMDSSKKFRTKTEFDDNLRPNEKLAIFDGNLQRSADHKRFSFWNLDESMQLLVPEKKKVDFGVQFQPGVEENDLDSRERTDASSRKKKKPTEAKNSDGLKNSNYCHVAMIKLMLGSTTVQDFVIICSIV